MLLEITNRIVHMLPSTRCFALKRALYRLCGAKIGRNVRICSSVSILGDHPLTIGENTWIGHETLILASAPIQIGRNVNIAPRCFIGTGTHEIDSRGRAIAGRGVSLPVTIGDGSWLCTHTVMIAGSSIGEKSITAAGAIITKNVPAGELWGGVPAKFIKKVV